MTSVIDKSFSYDNVYLSNDYHLVKNKKSHSDSLQIIPTESPHPLTRNSRRSSLVAFYKLAHRQLHPHTSSPNKLLNLEELADGYMRKHTPQVDFKTMVKRDVSKYLTNKM